MAIRNELQQNLLELQEHFDRAMSDLGKLPVFTDEEKAARGHAAASIRKLKDKGAELAQLSYNLQSI